MAVYNSYFPSGQPEQILWLPNFVTKLGVHAATLGYQPADIASVIVDCNWALYCIQKVGPAAKTYAQSMTAAIKTNLYSDLVAGSPVTLPGIALPTPIPTQAMPGALTRLFIFIKLLKLKAGYTTSIGEDLGVIGEEEEENPDAVPRLGKIVVRGGEVIIPFFKDGHMGVYIECSIDGGAWAFVTIDTTSPYNDARPLAPGKLAEKRRYRLCFWDGEPTNVWVTTEEVAFAG